MKDFLLLIAVCIVAIGIGAALFFVGPTSLQTDVQNALESSQTQSEAPQAVQFTVLEQGTLTFSIANRTNYRITSTYDLETLWPLIYGDRDAPAIPNVDFSNYEVLALFDGTHSTDGYGIQALELSDQDPVRTLTIEHLSPAANCATTAGLTEPFEIIEVPKTTYTLAHIDQMGTSTCATN